MSFADQRFSADGLSLADPNSSGDPLWLRRNNGVFMVYEQLLARAAPGSDKGIAFFVYSIDYKVFGKALRSVVSACRESFAATSVLTKA